MAGRVGRRLGQRDHAQVNVGQHQAFFMLTQHIAQRCAIRAVDAREAAARQQQLALQVVGAQHLMHRLGHGGTGGDHEAAALCRIDLAGRVVHFRAQRMGRAPVEREAGPGGDVDLLVLCVHRVLAQGLQMLPAAQHAHVADGGLHHRQVGAVALAKHRTLHMGGLEFATGLHHPALVVDQQLAHVQAAAGFFAETGRQPDLAIARGLGQPVAFGRADDQRVVVVALHKGHAHCGRGQPDPPGVAGNPGFGEGDQLRALARGVLHQRDGLVDGAIDVQKDRRSLDGGNAQFRVGEGGHVNSPERAPGLVG